MGTLVSGENSSVSAVYAEYTLGKRKVKYSSSEVKDGSADVSRGPAHMPYNLESEVNIELWDHRGLQSFMRGDPLIGKGKCVLSPNILDCQVRFETLELVRDLATSEIDEYENVIWRPGVVGHVLLQY